MHTASVRHLVAKIKRREAGFPIRAQLWFFAILPWLLLLLFLFLVLICFQLDHLVFQSHVRIFCPHYGRGTNDTRT